MLLKLCSTHSTKIAIKNMIYGKKPIIVVYNCRIHSHFDYLFVYLVIYSFEVTFSDSYSKWVGWMTHCSFESFHANIFLTFRHFKLFKYRFYFIHYSNWQIQFFLTCFFFLLLYLTATCTSYLFPLDKINDKILIFLLSLEFYLIVIPT